MEEPVKKSKIYTRTGDQGSSSLFTGERRQKDDLVFEALGNVDELNSCLGLAAQKCAEHEQLSQMIEFIQSRLFDVGAVVATPRNSDSEKVQMTSFDRAATERLENWIDVLDARLPALCNFILPSGGEAAARLHLARSVCRRAERSLVQLAKDGEVDENTFRFMNRLSDFLFVAARTMTSANGLQEKIWKKNNLE